MASALAKAVSGGQECNPDRQGDQSLKRMETASRAIEVEGLQSDGSSKGVCWVLLQGGGGASRGGAG